jgi:hypothetical protein
MTGAGDQWQFREVNVNVPLAGRHCQQLTVFAPFDVILERHLLSSLKQVILYFL